MQGKIEKKPCVFEISRMQEKIGKKRCVFEIMASELVVLICLGNKSAMRVIFFLQMFKI